MNHVLIVEDDPMVALINIEYLMKIGEFSIIGTATNEKEVMEFLAKEKVDLILLDVFLTGENGVDILKKIRESSFLQDVIMITAENNSSEIKRALSFGCLDYLIKPFDFNRFEKAISKYFEKRSILSKEKLDQTMLDNLQKNTIERKKELPKGLNEKTLKKIEEIIDRKNTIEFIIKDISEEAKISNVTVKKYLDFLEERGKIQTRVVYGNIGRPLIVYKNKKGE